LRSVEQFGAAMMASPDVEAAAGDAAVRPAVNATAVRVLMSSTLDLIIRFRTVVTSMFALLGHRGRS